MKREIFESWSKDVWDIFADGIFESKLKFDYLIARQEFYGLKESIQAHNEGLINILEDEFNHSSTGGRG